MILCEMELQLRAAGTDVLLVEQVISNAQAWYI